MKVVRWILGIFISLLVILAVAIILLVNFINPNDYREQISQTISQKIHMPFTIQGDINWLFFPELGFKVNDVNIGDTNQKNLYAKLNRLEINLKILPLLHKQIEIQALQLSGLQLILPYQADNTSSTKATADSGTSTSATNNPLAGLAALPTLNLGNLAIDQSDISQLDQNGKVAWALHNFSFSGVNISVKNQFPVQTSFDFFYPAQNLTGHVNFKTYFGLNIQDQKLNLAKPKADFELTKNSNVTLKGNLELETLNADLANHMIDLKTIKGNLDNLNFTGNMTIRNYDKTPAIAGQLQSQANDLKKVLAGFGINLPETQNNNAFGNFALDTTFKLANNQLNLNPLKATLGNTQLQGTVSSSDVKNMAMRINLTSPSIAAADYLPKANPPKTINLSGLTVNMAILPPAGDNKNWLASTLNGSVNSQAINFNGENFSNIALVFDGKNQVFNFSKIHTNAYQGTIDSTAQVNLQGAVPKFSANPVIHNVQIQELLGDLEPKFKLTGVANVSGPIASQGSDVKTIMSNLNGNLHTQINNGVLHGIDLNYWLNLASALYHREPIPQRQPANAVTPFTVATASFNITQGVVNNRDLVIQTAGARATGQGSIDLNREQLNYKVLITKLNQDTGKSHNDIVPVNITGSFDNPSITPDMAMIAQQVVSKQVDKYKDKVAQQIGQKLGGGAAGNQVGQAVSNALGNFLGGK